MKSLHRPNPYASGGIDRAGHLRDDADWIAARLDDPRSRLVPVWRSRNLVEPDDQSTPRLLATEPAILADTGATALLGLIGGIAHFAVDLSHRDEAAVATLGQFQDLRSVGPLMAHNDGALMAYARGMMHWHHGHRFCGRCGNATESRQAGHSRHCGNADCATSAFPRTDPAVIMLVHDGDHALLGRQTIWPPGMHSVLAGFVEPGESLEDAVAREIFEEAGIEIADVTYRSSQPWPFPASIMLGFEARATTSKLNVNRDELEDARWYHRDELMASPEDETFRLPRRDSIAYRLVDDWLKGAT